jgi:DNA (cytosine-5)-methyltransferase 1
MNELALFAGAGGGILGGHLLGWQTVCAVEFDAYAASVLLARQNDGCLPPFPIWDDVRTFDGRPWRGIVDVVSGGFPCQAYSSATAGRGTADDLWPEMARVVADVAPRYVFAENTVRRAIDKAADDLESMGYSVKCLPLSAADLGADHIRKRYWLLAYDDMHGELRKPVDAEVAELPNVRASVWGSDPDESRMDDGLADRMDRLKSTGNGQVPIVAASAFDQLIQAARRSKRRSVGSSIIAR